MTYTKVITQGAHHLYLKQMKSQLEVTHLSVMVFRSGRVLENWLGLTVVWRKWHSGRGWGAVQEESLQTTVMSPSSSKQEINGLGWVVMRGNEGLLWLAVGLLAWHRAGSREDQCKRHDMVVRQRAQRLWPGCSSFSTAAVTPWCKPHWRDSQQKQLCISEGGSDPVSRWRYSSRPCYDCKYRLSRLCQIHCPCQAHSFDSRAAVKGKGGIFLFFCASCAV